MNDSASGQAFAEFELAVPGGGQPVSLTASGASHVHSSLRDTVYGTSVYAHRLRTRNTDFVDKHLKDAMATGTPTLRFRLGFGTPGSMMWLPWQTHVITYFSAVLEGIGNQAAHIIELETSDVQFLLDRSSRAVARKGTVSDIVTALLAPYHFSTVIEPTAGDGLYVQSFSSDLEFIRQRMLKRAQNEKNRGNYLFYFKDSAFHFHSPDFQADLHTVSYFQSNGAALTQSDRSQKMLDLGSAVTNMVVYNPYTGKTRVALSDPAKALRLSETIYDYSKTGTNKIISYHQNSNFDQEPEVIGQNVYEHARSEVFSLVLEVDRTIQIRHGDFVNMVITPGNSRTSVWSGLYLVSEAKHIVQNGSVRSYYTLARGEIRKSLTNLTTVRTGEDLLVIEQEAPGQLLNAAELKSSQLTKGAGKLAVDGRLYTNVQKA